jgi:hypothetical protein
MYAGILSHAAAALEADGRQPAASAIPYPDTRPQPPSGSAARLGRAGKLSAVSCEQSALLEVSNA